VGSYHCNLSGISIVVDDDDVHDGGADDDDDGDVYFT
jgi:hypothetical protein